MVNSDSDTTSARQGVAASEANGLTELLGEEVYKVAANFNLDERIKAAITAAFEEAGEERFIAEDSQQINGVWFNPAWGCDTMQHFIDALKDYDA